MRFLLAAMCLFLHARVPPPPIQAFKGKKIIITGGTRGIGRKAAELFVAEGGEVVITGRNQKVGQETARDLGCEFFAMDVSCEEDWKKLIARYPEWSVLFNNAGILEGSKGVEFVEKKTFKRIFMINLFGQVLGCKYAIKAMKEKGGSIINNASVGALGAFPFMDGLYPASKAAVVSFTKHVAIDCCKNGYKIRCNCILPGFTQTDMLDEAIGDYPCFKPVVRWLASKRLTSVIPIKSLATPDQIAQWVVFLASEKSGYVTGQSVVIDGGLSSRLFTL